MYVLLIGFIDIGIYTNSLLPPLPLRKAMKAEGYAFNILMGVMLLSLSRWFLVELSAKLTLFL